MIKSKEAPPAKTCAASTRAAAYQPQSPQLSIGDDVPLSSMTREMRRLDARHPASPALGVHAEQRVTRSSPECVEDCAARRPSRRHQEPSTRTVHEVAARGVTSGGGALPHVERLQAAFGPEHDLSGVRAHFGDAATDANEQMGAEAYARGEHIAFRRLPGLWLAAHEATHVLQQRARVSLDGGVGTPGDAHERHADAVADRVVAGQPCAGLLDGLGRRAGAGGSAVQMRKITLANGDTIDTEHKTADALKKLANGQSPDVQRDINDAIEAGEYMKSERIEEDEEEKPSKPGPVKKGDDEHEEKPSEPGALALPSYNDTDEDFEQHYETFRGDEFDKEDESKVKKIAPKLFKVAWENVTQKEIAEKLAKLLLKAKKVKKAMKAARRAEKAKKEDAPELLEAAEQMVQKIHNEQYAVNVAIYFKIYKTNGNTKTFDYYMDQITQLLTEE